MDRLAAPLALLVLAACSADPTLAEEFAPWQDADFAAVQILDLQLRERVADDGGAEPPTHVYNSDRPLAASLYLPLAVPQVTLSEDDDGQLNPSAFVPPTYFRTRWEDTGPDAGFYRHFLEDSSLPGVIPSANVAYYYDTPSLMLGAEDRPPCLEEPCDPVETLYVGECDIDMVMSTPGTWDVTNPNHCEMTSDQLEVESYSIAVKPMPEVFEVMLIGSGSAWGHPLADDDELPDSAILTSRELYVVSNDGQERLVDSAWYANRVSPFAEGEHLKMVIHYQSGLALTFDPLPIDSADWAMAVMDPSGTAAVIVDSEIDKPVITGGPDDLDRTVRMTFLIAIADPS